MYGVFLVTSESDIPDNVGYSIADPIARSEWRGMIAAIKRTLIENGLGEEIVFHGTSSKALALIEDEGISPTDIGHACPVKGSYLDGSFWGNILTAASYAEDTAAERHPGSLPVVIAVRTATLEADGLLLADAATFEYPNDGLTKLGDPEIMKRWVESGCDLPWHESLEDLGAIVATHQHCIPPEDFVVIRGMNDLQNLLAAMPGADVRLKSGCTPSPA